MNYNKSDGYGNGWFDVNGCNNGTYIKEYNYTFVPGDTSSKDSHNFLAILLIVILVFCIIFLYYKWAKSGFNTEGVYED